MSDKSQNLPDFSFWRDLITFKPSASVQDTVKAQGARFQNMDDGWGDVNLDYYAIKITQLPTIDGETPMTDSELFQYYRLNLQKLIQGGKTGFIPFEASQTTWDSADPAGALATFKISQFSPHFPNPDDGSVVLSKYHSEPGEHFWRFTPVWTEEDWGHPVSGNREFGCKRDENDYVIIYTRGADRVTSFADRLFNMITWPIWRGYVWHAADNLWKSLLRNFIQFVKEHGGDAQIISEKSDRYDWNEVRSQYTPFSEQDSGESIVDLTQFEADKQSLELQQWLYDKSDDNLRFAVWNCLMQIVRLGCANPAALEEQDTLGRIPIINFPSSFWSWVQLRAKTGKNFGQASMCEDYTLSQILLAPSPVSATQVASWARTYVEANKPPEPLIQEVHQAIDHVRRQAQASVQASQPSAPAPSQDHTVGIVNLDQLSNGRDLINAAGGISIGL